MLTRVEIDGFRSFVGFHVDLGPLHVIAGPNASGKSNFFDALHLLARLVTHDSLSEAFGAEIRGEPRRQFTSLGGNASVCAMSFAVDAIVPRHIRDPWGKEAKLSRTHLRYELTLQLTGETEPKLICVAHERLVSFNKTESQERLRFDRSADFEKAFLAWGSRATDFISTHGDKFVLHQDGKSGRKREHARQDSQGTALSAVNSAAFPHAFAMREVLSGLRVLRLEPEVLRRPSDIDVVGDPATRVLGPHGGHLPAALARLKNEDPQSLSRISKDLCSVVSDAKRVSVERDEVQNAWVAYVEFAHGDRFPASLLSDGTVRILALAAIRNDPHHAGIVCCEEPENGIHPQKLEGLFGVLRGLASRTSKKPRAGSATGDRLRQLLVNTHSPGLVAIVPRQTLLFASVLRMVTPGAKRPVLASVFSPVKDEVPLRARGELPTYVTRNEVERFLASVETPDWLQQPVEVG